MMKFSRYGGNPNVGVFAAANENVAFVAHDSDNEFVKNIEETLSVKTVRATVADSFVVGSLVALNSSFAIVSSLANERELKVLEKEVEVVILGDSLNAAGNNILMNDYGAIVNPEFDKTTVKKLEKTLGIEVVKHSIADVNTVGSVCRATNKGAAIHPEATDEEIEFVKKILKIDEVGRTTLNHGSRFISPCVLANSKGAVVGDTTTPIEMGKLEDALKLY